MQFPVTLQSCHGILSLPVLKDGILLAPEWQERELIFHLHAEEKSLWVGAVSLLFLVQVWLCKKTNTLQKLIMKCLLVQLMVAEP